MKHRILLALIALGLVFVACDEGPSAAQLTPFPTVNPTERASIMEEGRTIYGFFPSPPEATFESILGHFQAMGEHADFVLFQQNVPWSEFVDGVEGDSQVRADLRNQVTLSRMNGLDYIFVVDPLNGLNRREFFGLPFLWEASFQNPDVRAAYQNFTLWIVREFQPQYIGLASEINTYLDAHPDDVEYYMSLYDETYDLIKVESPDTQVFVTFQWDDLNNMFPSAAEGRPKYQINWEQVEAFEPQLDLWVISSYPYFAFPSGDAIPVDYYTPLLDRTDKPLAVAEGGWSSRPVGPAPGDPESQVAYLQAIDDQLGDRLAFWVYLVLSDFNLDSYREIMIDEGSSESDIDTLGFFSAVGLQELDGIAKPALSVWDELREAE
jgi:hypothetical protein